MKNIIQLLADRNDHLEKFAQLNETAMMKFIEGDFDELEGFYQSREGLLNVIGCIDRLLDQCDVNQSYDNSQKKVVLELFSEKNEIVTEILSQDLQILSLIEKAKSALIKELSSVKAGRKALKNYQSGPARSRVDEKV